MSEYYKIIVFGTDSCKFCKEQIQNLQEFSPDSKVIYFNLEEDNDALKMAQDLNLEYTPSTLVLSDDKVVLLKTGLCAADEVFFTANKYLPADSIEINNNTNISILCSFNVDKNKDIILKKQNKYIHTKVNNIKKINSYKIKKIFGSKYFDKYYKLSGKKLEGFLIELRIENNGIAKNI